MLDYSPIENNMVYEIRAFYDMIYNAKKYESYLETTEITMKCIEKIYATSGIDFGE